MIGYYVHHHGSGHLTRARIVAGACAEPVVALSSLPEPAGHPFAGWVQLDPDPALDDPADPTAGGALHWAPTDSAGYAARMHQLVQWCAAARPRLVVVDLSVEVAALVRLAGIPVAVMTLPGRRDDPAHELAFRLASRIIAPWPQAVYDPPHLHPYAGKTVYAGALSRFDGQSDVAATGRTATDGTATPRLLVLLGSGGGSVAATDVAAAAAAAGWSGRVLGGSGGAAWSGDVARELAEASVVVTHGGTNALAEVAALRRPAIVLPQPRPFDEQHATARALGSAGLATVLPGWPAAAEWPDVLAASRARGGAGWSRWNDGAGGRRIATALAWTAGNAGTAAPAGTAA